MNKWKQSSFYLYKEAEMYIADFGQFAGTYHVRGTCDLVMYIDWHDCLTPDQIYRQMHLETKWRFGYGSTIKVAFPIQSQELSDFTKHEEPHYCGFHELVKLAEEGRYAQLVKR